MVAHPLASEMWPAIKIVAIARRERNLLNIVMADDLQIRGY
jgi:hypothetical protein